MAQRKETRDEPKSEKLTKKSLRIRLYLAIGKITKVRQDGLLAGCKVQSLTYHKYIGR